MKPRPSLAGPLTVRADEVTSGMKAVDYEAGFSLGGRVVKLRSCTESGGGGRGLLLKMIETWEGLLSGV